MTMTEKTEIYAQYAPKVQRYIQSKVNNADLAEELTADVFLKIYEKLDTFDREKSALSTWVFTVARNTLIDYYRTRRVFEEIPEALADDSRIEEEYCTEETLEELADALETLDERGRDIILLRYYSGLTLTEIARRMGLSYAYVKVLHNKALTALRRAM